jgi:hypothetical protein
MFMISKLVVLVACFLSLDLIFVLRLSWSLARFLSLAWRCNLAIIIHRFNAQPVVYVLCRRHLGGIIYKQWELEGRLTFVRLTIEIWEIG